MKERMRMEKSIKRLAAVGMLVISSIAMGEDEGDRLDRYERGFGRRYPYIHVGDKKHELEYELKNMDSFILMEVEIEDDFFGERIEDMDDEILQELDGVLEIAARDLREVFHKPVRAAAEYEGENVFMKKY